MGWHRQLIGETKGRRFGRFCIFCVLVLCVYQPLRWMRKKKGAWRFYKKKEISVQFQILHPKKKTIYIYIHTQSYKVP